MTNPLTAERAREIAAGLVPQAVGVSPAWAAGIALALIDQRIETLEAAMFQPFPVLQRELARLRAERELLTK